MCFPFLTLPCVSLEHLVLVCEAPLDLRELSLVCILLETFLRPLGKELYQSPALLFFFKKNYAYNFFLDFFKTY